MYISKIDETYKNEPNILKFIDYYRDFINTILDRTIYNFYII